MESGKRDDDIKGAFYCLETSNLFNFLNFKIKLCDFFSNYFESGLLKCVLILTLSLKFIEIMSLMEVKVFLNEWK